MSVINHLVDHINDLTETLLWIEKELPKLEAAVSATRKGTKEFHDAAWEVRSARGAQAQAMALMRAANLDLQEAKLAYKREQRNSPMGQTALLG